MIQPDPPPPLSVVIPTLNAAATLPATLAALEEAGPAAEVVVVDGGSSDATPSLAPRCLQAPRGRGAQLAAGAEAARGEWLLFLHADTRLEPGWWTEACAHMKKDAERAAVFRFVLDDAAPQGLAESSGSWRGVASFLACPMVIKVF